MSIIIRILLFLVAFNVMLMIYSPFFPGTSEIKTDATDPIYSDKHNLRQYEGVADAVTVIRGLIGDWSTIAIFAAVVGIGGFVTRLVGGSINVALLLGIGIIIATLMAVWRTVGATFMNLNYNNNPTITTMFILIEIMIGIILVFKIADYLTGQQQSEGI